jgi:hypothetical protein
LKDLDVKITLVVTFFVFLKISTNLIEFAFKMLGISTPEIISPSFLVTLASYSIVNKRTVLRIETNEQSIYRTPTTN